LADGCPNTVYVYVGTQVRLRRTLLGMSQEKLGDALGLTFRQVQKYERGTNRIGGTRLFDISRVLEVPISSDPLLRCEMLELVRAYYRITDPQVRKQVHALANILGACGNRGEQSWTKRILGTKRPNSSPPRLCGRPAPRWISHPPTAFADPVMS
jgi:transcriptional regulator with XRE-family HTH domain